MYGQGRSPRLVHIKAACTEAGIFTELLCINQSLNHLIIIVDGNWSEWTDYGACTATCGDSGVMVRHRSCNHPTPSCNGAACEGSNSETIPCNRNVTCPSEFQ